MFYADTIPNRYKNNHERRFQTEYLESSIDGSAILDPALKYSFAASNTSSTETSYGKRVDALVSLGIAFLVLWLETER